MTKTRRRSHNELLPLREESEGEDENNLAKTLKAQIEHKHKAHPRRFSNNTF